MCTPLPRAFIASAITCYRWDMLIDAAVRRDLMSFRRDWAHWSITEQLTAKLFLLVIVSVLIGSLMH
jgi:carbon starvation protein CstA